MLELCEAFYADTAVGSREERTAAPGAPPTRLRLRTEVLAGTSEALVTGQADLAHRPGHRTASCRAAWR